MFREGAMPSSEPAMPASGGEPHDPRREYLDGLLVRLQLADQMEREDAEKERARNDEIELVTSEYTMNLLKDAAQADGEFRTQLEEKDLLDTDGYPTVGTDLGAYLTREITRSMSTRLKGFTDGLVDAKGFEDGIVRQLRNLIKNYQEPKNPYEDRRKTA